MVLKNIKCNTSKKLNTRRQSYRAGTVNIEYDHNFNGEVFDVDTNDNIYTFRKSLEKTRRKLFHLFYYLLFTLNNR